MKRLRLKKWVEVSLIIINLLMIIVITSEVENPFLYMFNQYGATIVYVFNSYLLIKYSRMFND